ncbi:MAG TPA: 16S rRNA (adenine(1518)-N(6)/adenine(1519)-N(6))-dimethyltransferase RsmA [Gemmatimonadaceae bacterium]|jgi:16S rRNA (adenine1518-N6/adenine1519-N6)-dimethyltransferase|nr:16S rRNA (adenine(1518)-N(6)/adenine(1519)-N(6))-dimethyltransferase RsmA [Gemmatimonadaceae bacterium]
MKHRARKRLGQHFLNDRRVLARIVEALDPRPNETIIEIGPGQGALTEQLAARAARLVAIELDRDLAAGLRQQFADRPNVRIVEGDVLDIRLAELSDGAQWSVTGNVPYYITTPILFHALASPRPRRIVLLVQREVGDRLAAAAGSEAYGALSATAQAVARVDRHGRVPAGSFHPKPAVDSVIVSLTPLDEPIVTADEEPAFKTLVQGAFSQRRKQMLRVVRSLFDISAEQATALLDACAIDVSVRPEVLAPQTFADLLRAAKRAGFEQLPETSGRRPSRSRSGSTERS